jgi:hypothetical protein
MKKLKKRKFASHRVAWTKTEKKALKAHSRAGTRIDELVQEFGRTEGALRIMGHKLGFGLGHQQRA